MLESSACGIIERNKLDMAGCEKVKKLSATSKEFNRILKNLSLENLELSKHLQEKALQLVNSKKDITSEAVKEQFHGKVL